VKLAAAILLLAAAGGACGSKNMPASIQEAKAKHEARLMAQPGVVSVGIGRDPDGAEVIVVGLDRERPEARAALPRELEGYPVRVQIIGSPRAQ
jgi:hypothetical protein